MKSTRENGRLKRNANFWSWTSFFMMLVLIGGGAMWSGRFPQHHGGAPDLEGAPALVFGFISAAAGLYGLYRFFFCAERKELAQPGFYELADLDDWIEKHRIRFRIEHDGYVAGSRGSAAPVFNYVLRVWYPEPLGIDFHIRRRDKVEIVLWYLGIERLRDVLTGHHYFDSRYKVAASDRGAFRELFNGTTIAAIERFDRDYPPIRLRNGWLYLNKTSIVYAEGPYAEAERVFDPHRGKVEATAAELIRLAEKIEARKALSLADAANGWNE